MEDPFRSIRKNANSKLENQKTVYNTLISLEEIPLLEGSVQNQEIEDEIMTNSLLYILAVAFPFISQSVIKNQRISLTKLFVRLFNLIAFEESKSVKEDLNEETSSSLSENYASMMLRSLLSLSEVLLLCFSNRNDPSALNSWTSNKSSSSSSLPFGIAGSLFAPVLNLSLDPRPKVRKRALELIEKLFSGNNQHPAFIGTLSFALNALNNNQQQPQIIHGCFSLLKVVLSTLNAASTTNQTTLNKDTEGLFDWALLRATIIAIKRSESIEDEFISSSANEVIGLLAPFSSKTKYDLVSLLKETPNISQEQPAIIISRLNLIPKLIRINDEVMLNTSLKWIFQWHLSPPSEAILQAVQSCLCEIIDKSIAIDASSIFLIYESVINSFSSINVAAFDTLICISSYLFKSTQPQSCQQAQKHISNLLTIISELATQNQVNACLEQAVKSLGIEFFLNALPLNVFKEESSCRVWLLPLLKSSITNSSLRYFISDILPIIHAIPTNALSNNASSIILIQLWELLPSFCDGNPVDLIVEISGIVDLINNELLLSGNQKLCHIGIAAIENIFNNEIFQVAMNNNNNEIEVIIRHESMKILPQLYQLLLSSSSDSNHQSILNCVTLVVKLNSSDIIIGFFKNIMTTFLDISDNEKLLCLYLDLIYCLLPKISIEMSDLYLKTIIPYLKVEALQKKIYKSITNISQIPLWTATALISLAVPVSFSAKKARLQCLACLVPMIPSDSLEMVAELLPETILAVKEVNEKTRSIAYTLIIKLCQRFKNGGKLKIEQSPSSSLENENETIVAERNADLSEFIAMLSAGLSSPSSHMVSATISCISRVLFEYHTEISKEKHQEIFETILAFSNTKSREIAKAILGFFKVYLSVFHDDENGIETTQSNSNNVLSIVLKSLLDSLFELSKEHHNALRSKTRFIIEKCIRKFGIDKITPLIPQQHMPLIDNIQKRKQRAKNNSNNSTASKQQTGGKSFENIFYQEECDGNLEDGVKNDDDDLPQMLKGSLALKSKVSNSSRLLLSGDDLLAPNKVSSNTNRHGSMENTISSRSSNSFKRDESNGKMIIKEEVSEKEQTQNKKRSRDDDENEEQQHFRSHNRSISKKTKNNSSNTKKKGDAKKAGDKFMPYAYIPLMPQQATKTTAKNSHQSRKKYFINK